MTRSFFITGTGTDVGKTLVSAALCHQHTRRGYRVKAVKPIVSGFADGAQSDPALLLQSSGLSPAPEHIRAIAPWRFAAPLSPHMAAWAEGHAPRAEEVAEFCRAAENNTDLVLAEGAGGIMTPINDAETQLDVCALLQWPVIVVCGTYLGSLSHTLTAFSALESRGIKVHAIVVSASENSTVSLEETARSIRMFAPAHAALYTVPRLPAHSALWEHVPSLSDLCLSNG